MQAVCKIFGSQGTKIASKHIAFMPTVCQQANFSHSSSKSQANFSKRIELDYEELSSLMCFADVALIDVRSPVEIKSYGSIPGAVNIPLNEVKSALQLPEEQFEDQFFLQKPTKNARNLIFYARGPNASSAAVEIAHRLGFKGSRQYTGGWEDYCKRTGLPLKKSQHVKMLPLMDNYDHGNFKRYAI